ncbi:MAG: CocE/NonD family hydrolase C-terminal non-catalytic domain-containing protein, partial [Solirubrobacteraceae bacterium]
ASLCWDTEPLPERVELLGRGRARLTISVDRPQALVAVRVCDVAPDGTSTLVARGLLNLSRREGHDRSVPMPVGEPVRVAIPMQSTAYAIPAGHRVRLALSPTYWPWAWPSPEPVTLTIHCGPDSVLALPRRAPSGLHETVPTFGPPESGEPLASELTQLRPPGRRVRRDLATGEIQLEFDWHGSRTRIVATDTEMGEENVNTYRIVEGDPLSAAVDCGVTTTLRRPGWSTEVRAASTMTCDRETFTVATTLDAFEDGVRVHAAAHVHTFPRDGV